MKQSSIVILAFTFIFFGDLFPFAGTSSVYVGPIFPLEAKEKNPAMPKEGSGLPSTSFSLQVASLPTEAGARKETERLKVFNIKANYTIREDASKKKWFVIYLGQFKNKDEATRYGHELIHKGIIKNFKIFSQKEKGKGPVVVKEASPPPSLPSQKEPTPLPEKSPVRFGPISIKEEETALRIDISLDRKILPELTADKVANGSRLIVTFKNIDRTIVPVEFYKVQSKMLLSFSLTKKGTDCTFILLLNPTYNYQVTRDYFEKEKIYSLVIGIEPTAQSDQAN